MNFGKKQEYYLRAIFSILSMVFLIYVGSTFLKPLKLDFTEEGLYTLSDGTKNILGKLDSEIKLKLYYSKTAANKGTEGLRAFNNHFLYVKELLKEFRGYSRNNLNLEIIDPRPDTKEEEDAIAYGLKKFYLTETERYFFGLVAENESGTEKVIEFFDPNNKDKLEYDLIKLIFTVLNPRKKTVGILSSLPVINEEITPYMAQIMRMQGRNVSDSWISVKLLKELYEVKRIKQDEKEISGVDSLIIVHPKGFKKETLFAIDQFVMKGGKLLVLVDPNAMVAAGGGGRAFNASPDKEFKKLMDKWGITLKEGVFAGDKYLSGVGKLNPYSPPGRLLPLVNCNSKCTNSYNDSITSGIEKMTFFMPGALDKKDVEGVKVTPILSTTEKGNTYKAVPYELGNPNTLWKKFREGDKPVIMAYKAIGKFKTAFPDGVEISENNEGKGKKKKGKNKSKKLTGLKESEKESAIIVFADVDFIHDQLSFKQTFLGPAVANGNSTILLNSVESLSGDVDLMSVRSKSRISRSFTVIDAIEFEEEKQTANKVKEIQASITRFQAELAQLGKKANDGNIALLQNEGIRKKKELAKKIAMLKGELRDVKRVGREKIEGIGKIFQYINTLLVPIFVILIGVWYSNFRKKRLAKENNTKEAQTPNNNEALTAGGEV